MGVDRHAAEHTTQTIDHRLSTTVPSQGSDYTGERTERIGASFIPGAVRDLPSYHSPTQRPLRPVVSALIVQKSADSHGRPASQARSAYSCRGQASDGL